MLIGCDDCELKNKIGNWEIELTPDNNFFEENHYPDWYGYKKIDGKKDLRIFSFVRILLNNRIIIYIIKFLKRT
tara:strand:- start:52 stop:273 length:222 start_codon:yes stop_codon:yes gene_type:complete